MLTSDELSALDNVSMWVVDGDFKSCNERDRETEGNFHEHKGREV